MVIEVFPSLIIAFCLRIILLEYSVLSSSAILVNGFACNFNSTPSILTLSKADISLAATDILPIAFIVANLLLSNVSVITSSGFFEINSSCVPDKIVLAFNLSSAKSVTSASTSGS